MPTVLFVCTANMCRSPLAEVLFREMLRRRGLQPGWRTESAGVYASDGQPATEFSRQVAAERGLDLSSHHSKPVDAERLHSADLVLVMEPVHRQVLQDGFPQLAGRVHLLTEMAGESGPVEDPVGTTIENYRETADRLVDLLSRGFDRIQALVRTHSGGPIE
jgi:protein-tyrosine-phosphatase